MFLLIFFREYTRSNESLIVDTFQGQLQSEVKLIAGLLLYQDKCVWGDILTILRDGVL